MKMQFLVAGLVAAALFASTPDAAAHGGWASHGGNWAGGYFADILAPLA